MQMSDDARKINGKTLPKIGYISYTETGTPVAAGFLRKVEGGYGQIDTLVTNPNIPSEIRHKALTRVVDALIAAAKVEGLEGIISYTRDESVLKRAQTIGFRPCPHTVISLDLKGWVAKSDL